jgi:hypothetical protein
MWYSYPWCESKFSYMSSNMKNYIIWNIVLCNLAKKKIGILEDHQLCPTLPYAVRTVDLSSVILILKFLVLENGCIIFIKQWYHRVNLVDWWGYHLGHQTYIVHIYSPGQHIGADTIRKVYSEYMPGSNHSSCSWTLCLLFNQSTVSRGDWEPKDGSFQPFFVSW